MCFGCECIVIGQMEGASNIQHHFDEKNGFLALIIEFLVLAAYYFRARPALYLPFAFIYCIVFRGGFYYCFIYGFIYRGLGYL